jgi:riboflavin biosynthesis pyrimidine reductase
MRELILKMSISIDGFVASPDGGAQGSSTTDVFAPPMNQIPKVVFSKQGTSVLQGTDTTLALRDARANAGPERRGALQTGADSWAQAYVATGNPAEEIAKLKAQRGKPIVAHGGASFARSLIALGVVDQYALLVHPVALGKGLPLFAGLPAPKILKLLSSTTFPRGTVAQIYRPA